MRAYAVQHADVDPGIGRTVYASLRSVTPIDAATRPDTGYIDIEYRHSALTAALVDAGWLTTPAVNTPVVPTPSS